MISIKLSLSSAFVQFLLPYQYYRLWELQRKPYLAPSSGGWEGQHQGSRIWWGPSAVYNMVKALRWWEYMHPKKRVGLSLFFLSRANGIDPFTGPIISHLLKAPPFNTIAVAMKSHHSIKFLWKPDSKKIQFFNCYKVLELSLKKKVIWNTLFEL